MTAVADAFLTAPVCRTGAVVVRASAVNNFGRGPDVIVVKKRRNSPLGAVGRPPGTPDPFGFEYALSRPAGDD
jgi:hypothetical protein